MKLPKRIYVVVEGEGSEDQWLNAAERATGFDHGRQVGIYELKTTRVVRVTVDLIAKGQE